MIISGNWQEAWEWESEGSGGDYSTWGALGPLSRKQLTSPQLITGPRHQIFNFFSRIVRYMDFHVHYTEFRILATLRTSPRPPRNILTNHPWPIGGSFQPLASRPGGERDLKEHQQHDRLYLFQFLWSSTLLWFLDGSTQRENQGKEEPGREEMGEAAGCAVMDGQKWVRLDSSEEVSPDTEKVGCVLWGQLLVGLTENVFLRCRFPCR